MRRGSTLHTITLVALLLPGLALAAPTAGACGHCDRGTPCATMTAPEPVAEAHSCCGAEPVKKPAESPSPPNGAKACDCGRDAPDAISVVGSPAPGDERSEALDAAVSPASLAHPMAIRAGEPAPAPPPHPLIFLIDCVFLT